MRYFGLTIILLSFFQGYTQGNKITLQDLNQSVFNGVWINTFTKQSSDKNYTFIDKNDRIKISFFNDGTLLIDGPENKDILCNYYLKYINSTEYILEMSDVSGVFNTVKLKSDVENNMLGFFYKNGMIAYYIRKY